MRPNHNPFRGSNVCHRLVLPSSGRRRRARPEEQRVRTRLGSSRTVQVSAPAEAAGDGKVDVQRLERRLAKVSALLAMREDELQKLVANGAEDLGLASIYDQVQGLQDDEPDLERKRELMSRIFEANVELQRRLDS